MRIFRFILLVIIILFGISFATLNSAQVAINYYFGSAIMPLSLLLACAFALGTLITILFTAWIVMKAKIMAHRLRKRLLLAEKEIENLRAIPLQDKV